MDSNLDELIMHTVRQEFFRDPEELFGRCFRLSSTVCGSQTWCRLPYSWMQQKASDTDRP